MVQRAGIPIIDTKFVTVGGGIGSFVTVDFLRIYGVPAQDITVLTQLETPWQSYEYLTRVSQIPRGERLRSDSKSTPDNIWGFPSYAVREAFGAKGVSGFVKPLWNVLTEPIIENYYTPKAGQAFETMERESNRIGYQQCVRKGQVRMVRRRREGGYFTILTPPPGATATKRLAYRSPFVHIAIGYPGLKLLPDLQRYREYYRDPSRVVNAYEPHEHVYQQLALRPGTVVIRGGGIVASRVLQRLIDDRDRNRLQTQIIHVFRTYITGTHGPNIFKRRRGGDGWAYQGFNYPKSVWGGQLKAKIRGLEGEERAQAYKEMGGTNTPIRKSWQEQLKRGRREGWYRTVTGEVSELRPGPNGQGVITYRGDLLRLRHRLHRPGGRHPGAPGAGRSARSLRRRPQPGRPARCRPQLRGDRHAQPARPDVRLRQRHPRRVLPRRRHLPRFADRRPGDLRRPGQARLLQEVRRRTVDQTVVALGPSPQHLGGGRGTHPVRADSDPHRADDRRRRPVDADHHPVPADR
jgi:hypothetical protein